MFVLKLNSLACDKSRKLVVIEGCRLDVYYGQSGHKVKKPVTGRI